MIPEIKNDSTENCWRLVSKQHHSAADTGNPMRSSLNMANNLIMTIVWQYWCTSVQALALCNVKRQCKMQMYYAQAKWCMVRDFRKWLMADGRCWTWASPYLDPVLSPLDLQIKNVYCQHSNLIFHQQLVELAEIAQHQPDWLDPHAQIYTAFAIISQNPSQGWQQGRMGQ